MIMKIEIKIKFEMKKNKYEIRKQNVQNEKDEDRNIKIIKVFLELNRYAGYYTGNCNRI